MMYKLRMSYDSKVTTKVANLQDKLYYDASYRVSLCMPLVLLGVKYYVVK